MNALLYDWPYFALVAGLVGVVALVAWPRGAGAPSRWRDPTWLVCLMLPVYMLHQFEEHGINLLGEHYHFINDFCGLLGYPNLADCPASPEFVLAVNVGGVWLAGVLAIAWRRRNVMIGACAMGLPLVNLVSHVGPAVLRGGYNSGVMTAILLFAPVCGWTLLQLRKSGILDRRRMIAIIASGVLCHASLAISLVAHAHGLLPQALLLVVNVVNGVIPAMFGTLVRVDDKTVTATAERASSQSVA